MILVSEKLALLETLDRDPKTLTDQRRWEISGLLRRIADDFLQVNFSCGASHTVGEATEHCWMKAHPGTVHTNYLGKQWEE
jgi:hypothetical protein